MGMLVAWRKQDATSWLRQLRIPAAIAVVLGIVIPALVYGRMSLLLFVGCASAVWIFAVALLPIIRSLRREKGAAGITRAALGMSVAHIGMALFVIGVTVVSAFGVETDRSLARGQSIEVAGYEFRMSELRQNVEGPNYTAIEAKFDIHKDGRYVATVSPQKRRYLSQQNLMTEAGIRAGLDKDLFVALGDPLGNNAWSVRVQYKPLIRLIWLGALVMAFGGLIAVSDRRYRVSVREKAAAADKTAEATA